MKYRSVWIVMVSLGLILVGNAAFGQAWMAAGTIEVIATTQNNDGRKFDRDHCADKSSDGKWCADVVDLEVRVSDGGVSSIALRSGDRIRVLLLE